MALTLIATAGAADANTYCTLAEADVYFTKRLHKTSWEEASSGDKNMALAWASSILDNEMNWHGWTMYPDVQALRWPRSGAVTPDGRSVTSVAIPQFLKNATAEFAMQLIADDRMADNDMLGIKQIAVSSIQITRDKYDQRPLIPQAVWQMVRPYGTRYSSTSSVNLIRG